jgi:MerR family redox-sensitive transcriptional activator SoxR
MARTLRGAGELSIGEVARRAGVRTSAIRFYESVGLLAPARRVSGRRVYGVEILDVLRLVALAKGAGFTMTEIRRLLTGFDRATPASARWQTLARSKLDEVTAVIDRAQRMRAILEALLTCECVSLTDCVRPL